MPQAQGWSLEPKWLRAPNLGALGVLGNQFVCVRGCLWKCLGQQDVHIVSLLKNNWYDYVILFLHEFQFSDLYILFRDLLGWEHYQHLIFLFCVTCIVFRTDFHNFNIFEIS